MTREKYIAQIFLISATLLYRVAGDKSRTIYQTGKYKNISDIGYIAFVKGFKQAWDYFDLPIF